MDVNGYELAVKKLYKYLLKNHWNGDVLDGPDPVGKIHWRVTRFVRSYLPWLPNDDRYVYLQAQAYWIKGNLALYELTKDPQYLMRAEKCADYIVSHQPPDGAWRHPPIRWRKGFISTVEGAWASLGLLDAYRVTKKSVYLDAALKWYDFQVDHIGFQSVNDGLAANYYSHSSSIVPNVTTKVIWLTAELYKATGNEKYLTYTEKMLSFIEYSQLPTGELPYELKSRPHFMCYQYNSFQFMDLLYFYKLTDHKICRQILIKIAAYLSTGVTERDHCRYNCFKDVPEVNYWTAAIATALRQAHEFEFGDYLEISERAYQHILTRQRNDGGFDFSMKNYGFLQDRRSYPRYLAMIHNHLLYRALFEPHEFHLNNKLLIMPDQHFLKN